jgi:hypothetical protein
MPDIFHHDRRRNDPKIDRMLCILEELMATVPAGLAALQTFTSTTFPAYVTQQQNDYAALSTAIQDAIAALQNSGASEDTAVQTAVASLTSAMATVESNETNLENLSASLAAAAPPPAATSTTATPAAKRA